jgi:uncharacterized membrane protein YvbJ
MKRTNLKFCPRCGAQNHATDAFCIRCGYNFSRRKKTNWGPIIIVLLLLVVGWVVLRTFMKLPIIPPEVIDWAKNLMGNKTT